MKGSTTCDQVFHPSSVLSVLIAKGKRRLVLGLTYTFRVIGKWRLGLVVKSESSGRYMVGSGKRSVTSRKAKDSRSGTRTANTILQTWNS